MIHKRHLRRAGIGGLSALVCASTALMVSGAPANAAWQATGGQIGIVDTDTGTAGTQGATAVQAGDNGQALDNIQFLVPNQCANGDSIELNMTGGSATGPLLSEQNIGFSAAPSVSVDGPYTAASKIGPTSADTTLTKDSTAGATTAAPAFTVGAPANKDSVPGNEQVTLTNSSTCAGTAPTDLWLVTVSGVKADLGKGVSAGAIKVTPTATDAPAPPATTGTANTGLFGTAYTVPGFVMPASITVANPSSIVADGSTQAVGDITVNEQTYQGLTAGTYAVTVSGADIKNDNTTHKVTATLTSSVTGESVVSDAVVDTSGTNNKVSFTLTQANAAASAQGFTTVKLSGLLLSSGSNSKITYTLSGGSVDTALATPGAPANQTDIEAPTVDFTGTSHTTPSRLSGLDRYATAAKIALANAGGSADTMVLASGQAYPDALSSAFLTQRLGSGAGVLLTKTNSLPDSTANALRQLDTDTVYVVGGPAAVSDGVLDQVKSVLQQNVGAFGSVTVKRISGDDRYATNKAVNSFASLQGTDPIGSTQVTFGKAKQKTAILATGLDFADALAGSPATAGANGDSPIPLILTKAGELNPDAASQLRTFGIQQVLLIGGTSAISSGVESTLTTDGYNVLRLSGADRYGTAAAVADFETMAATPTSDVTGYDAGLGFDAGAANDQDAYLATGLDFADALSGGPLAADTDSPILLTKSDVLSGPTSDWLTKKKADYDSVIGLGGVSAISDAVLSAANQAVFG